jgi:hypothetical protein
MTPHLHIVSGMAGLIGRAEFAVSPGWDSYAPVTGAKETDQMTPARIGASVDPPRRRLVA